MNKAMIKKVNELIKEYDDLEIEFSDRAIAFIEKEARKILSKDDGLDRFVMAMGSAFFTYKKDSEYDIHSSNFKEKWIGKCSNPGESKDGSGIIHEGFQEKFFEMVFDLNDKFNICGYPMQFTATGKVINNW